MNEKKILFISHDALRTGAPIIFLNFLRWFRDNASIPFRIMLRNGGELEPEFEALAPVSAYNKKAFSRGWLEKGASRFPSVQRVANRIHFNSLKKQLVHDNIGLIYSNTITNGKILEFLSFLDCPIITHVHELEYWILRTGSNNFSHVKKYTTHYIAVSEAVKQNLIINHDIPENKIDVVHGFVLDSALEIKPVNASHIRKSMDIPENAFIVGGSGLETWRKGKDLFVQLALAVALKCKDKPVHFVWIGGNHTGMDFYEIHHDITRAGLSDRVHFIAHVSNPMDYYAAFDIFVMISREDPYPLVNLEVASLGKPIVCFDNAGGTPEFVEDDAGFVVPYLDINGMADKVITLSEDEDLRKQLGNKAAQKVMERHDISVAAHKILSVINHFLGPSNSKSISM